MSHEGLRQDLTPEQMDGTLGALGLRPPAPAPEASAPPDARLGLIEGRSVPEVRMSQPASRPVPSIGRIVHYYAYGTPGGEYAAGVPRAALVTDVHNPGDPESALSLAVFNPTGMFFNIGVYYSPEPKGGCWGWPPFVPPAVSDPAKP